MPLPMLDLPTYTVFLPSQEKEIKFRPFIVKEEKLLLIALESDDFKTILNSTKQVIQNCIVTEGVDVDTLPLHEIEYLFLNLRARSMGEKIELAYICENVVDSKKCKGDVSVEVDLLKVALEMKQLKMEVQITDQVGIKFKYPNVEASEVLANKNADIDTAINLIERCTEHLFDSEQVYRPEDMAEGEFKQFIESLTQSQFANIQGFFDDIPKIKYDTTAVCRKCKKEHRIYLEGLQDFFV